ncbi:MAG: hypothetical protein GWP69_11395 [Gammaproteobacteria bacterium]|nr:hypothetical protein [Gammaproteobacteria bacterium]
MLTLLRKGILVYVLILVAVGHWLTTQRTTSWDRPLSVAVYPINGDGSQRSAQYIKSLEWNSFKVIDEFMTEEATHYGVQIKQPVHTILAEPVEDQPPAPPHGGNAFQVMLWSLKLRYWSWSVDRGADPPSSDVEIFVRYFDPDTNPRLAHSLGLQKGLIGVVNAFASPQQAGSNKVIIAHELLHTLGASDKYDPATGQPLYPDGYAEPEADPRLPQKLAELMGGRIPFSATDSQIPRSLDEVIIGTVTGQEIRWREH